MYKSCFKRFLDVLIASTLLIIFIPILFVVFIVLSVTISGKPFFVQKRPGLGGKIFKILKFKTMNDQRDEHGNLLSDDLRITPFGSLIRMASLDELPQLVNVICGDMSLIGPRPLLPEYMPLYSCKQRQRHNVRPGITGWAQVNGRNAISWEKKFEYDLWYVDNVNFLVDMRIIFLTIKKVCYKEGISSSNSVSMEKFTGN